MWPRSARARGSGPPVRPWIPITSQVHRTARRGLIGSLLSGPPPITPSGCRFCGGQPGAGSGALAVPRSHPTAIGPGNKRGGGGLQPPVEVERDDGGETAPTMEAVGPFCLPPPPCGPTTASHHLPLFRGHATALCRAATAAAGRPAHPCSSGWGGNWVGAAVRGAANGRGGQTRGVAPVRLWSQRPRGCGAGMGTFRRRTGAEEASPQWRKGWCRRAAAAVQRQRPTRLSGGGQPCPRNGALGGGWGGRRATSRCRRCSRGLLWWGRPDGGPSTEKGNAEGSERRGAVRCASHSPPPDQFTVPCAVRCEREEPPPPQTERAVEATGSQQKSNSPGGCPRGGHQGGRIYREE